MSDTVKRVKDADHAYCDTHKVNLFEPGGLARVSGIKTLAQVIRRHRYETAERNMYGRKSPSTCDIWLSRRVPGN